MRIAQMPKAVGAHPRRETSIEFRFGVPIDARGGRRNRPRERGIVKWLVGPTRVHASIIADIPRQRMCNDHRSRYTS